jgi:hypothetical protein
MLNASRGSTDVQIIYQNDESDNSGQKTHEGGLTKEDYDKVSFTPMAIV